MQQITVEQIHKDVEKESIRFGQMVKRLSGSNPDKDKKLSQLGFKNSKTTTKEVYEEPFNLQLIQTEVEEYQEMFGGFQYMSHSSVQRICKRYGFYYGDALILTEEIPDANSEEIFHFSEEYARIVGRWALEDVISLKHNVERLKDRRAQLEEELYTRLEVIFNKDRAIYHRPKQDTFNTNIDRAEFNFVKDKCLNHEDLYKALLINCDLGTACIAASLGAIEAYSLDENVYELQLSKYKKYPYMHIACFDMREVLKLPTLHVIADPDSLIDFDDKANFYGINEGSHRIVKDTWSTKEQQARERMQLEDPLVLAETLCGFILISKWGPEALIDEVAS